MQRRTEIFKEELGLYLMPRIITEPHRRLMYLQEQAE
jgi:hypothetical protein